MIVSNCILCKNKKIDKKKNRIVCPAFPDGIPQERYRNLYDPELKGKVCANNTRFEEE